MSSMVLFLHIRTGTIFFFVNFSVNPTTTRIRTNTITARFPPAWRTVWKYNRTDVTKSSQPAWPKVKVKWALSWENLSSRVCNQVWLKPVCLTTEASLSLEILDIASIGMIQSKEWTTKMLIRLRDVQADLHLCCSHIAKNSFSHEVAHNKHSFSNREHDAKNI